MILPLRLFRDLELTYVSFVIIQAWNSKSALQSGHVSHTKNGFLHLFIGGRALAFAVQY